MKNRFQQIDPICSHYHKSLLKKEGGEWNWPIALKPIDGYPLFMGWLHALLKVKSMVDEGLNLTTPLLVLCSSAGHVDSNSENFRNVDILTDVNMTISLVPNIARTGKVQLVKNAIHDVFLSSLESRENAYDLTWEFLSDLFKI